MRTLTRKRIPFLIVGLSAASLQGAPVVTQDIDLWIKDLGDPRFSEALRSIGGFYVPPFMMNPPAIGGPGFDLFDIITGMHGLRSFDVEFKRSIKLRLGSTPVRVLPLERILKSKKALGRPKDLAVIPLLEDSLKTIRSLKLKCKIVLSLLLILMLAASCAPGKRSGRPRSMPGMGLSTGSGTPARTASDALIEEGRLAMERGLYDRSLDRFQEALTLDPSNGACFYYLAFVKLRTGEYGEVWGLLEKAESLLAKNAEWILRIEELNRKTPG